MRRCASFASGHYAAILRCGPPCVKHAASSDRVAAVDVNYRAGYEVGGVRGEEDRAASHFFGLAEASRWRAHYYLVVEWAALRGQSQVGRDPSRHDRIDLDIVRRQLDRHGLGR